MSAPPVILCLGRFYCDVIFTGLPRMPSPGTEVFCEGVGFHAGGGAAITAAHLTALGNATALAAILPGPPMGDLILHELTDPGVNLDLCETANPGTEPQMTVALTQGGERAFVTHRAGPAIPKISAAAAKALGVTHIHLGEMTTLIDHPDVLDLARALGATLSLDCSWDEELDLHRVEALLPRIDVFLPNAAEAQLLRDMGLSEPFAPLTVVKEGEAGATAYAAETPLHAPAHPARVIDTTGAGDAFNAGFLDAWLQKEPLVVCLEAGNAAGAKAVSYRGGIGPALNCRRAAS